MRLILRILGTWLLGLALILLVMDGTRMLAAQAWATTSLVESWEQYFPGGPEAARERIEAYTHPLLWDPVVTTLIGWPGWAVLGGLGIVLAALGRRPSSRRFIQQDLS